MFDFLKYLQPTHYFQLGRKDGTSIFPVASELPRTVLEQIKIDQDFKSEHAAEYYLSWMALQKGYIGDAPTYPAFKKVPLIDEYIFMRKEFHPVWSVYILCLRLVKLKNPYREINSWWKSREINRRQSSGCHISYFQEWGNQQSGLLNRKPLVSVIIPTLNRYDYLRDVLLDLENQDYKNFEVLVVDQSEPFQPGFYENFKVEIRLFRQEEKALWLARNTAIENAKGEYLAFSEDDVRIASDWLSNHLKCIDFFNADVSAGVFYPAGSQIPQERSFFAVASQFATGNSLLYKRIFYETGLFDRQFEKQRMGDGEFGLRLYLAGYKCISNPYSSCIDIKAGTGGLRQMGSWDAYRPRRIFGPRPVPSVLYYYRKYFGKKRCLYALLKNVPPSIMPYRYRKNKVMSVFGGIISLFLFPLVLLQVVTSWRLADEKLKKGDLIKKLKKSEIH